MEKWSVLQAAKNLAEVEFAGRLHNVLAGDQAVREMLGEEVRKDETAGEILKRVDAGTIAAAFTGPYGEPDGQREKLMQLLEAYEESPAKFEETWAEVWEKRGGDE
jgi:hypothetical protein